MVTEKEAFTEDRQAADNGVSACNCIFMGKGEDDSDEGAKRNVQAIARNAPLGGTNQEFHQESRDFGFFGYASKLQFSSSLSA